jgi:hypothetical protein
MLEAYQSTPHTPYLVMTWMVQPIQLTKSGDNLPVALY